MWELYDRLLAPLPDDVKVDQVLSGSCWTMAAAAGQVGVAATHFCQSRPFTLEEGRLGDMSWKEVGTLVKSWNFTEASIGAAAINAFYNQRARIGQEARRCLGVAVLDGRDAFSVPREPMGEKKVATIGHFCFASQYLEKSKELYILEREPRPGDYPDSACEYILPDMDYVYITGFTLVNKTLPRLLALCRKSKVILVGPSVPMAPVLFEFGVDELAGTIYPDPAKAQRAARLGTHRSMVRAGEPVRLGWGGEA